jgi:hypothetical protein
VKWPGLFNPTLELEVNHELVLAAKELNEKLHEDVKHVCFINVSDCVEGECFLRKHNREIS